MLKLFIIFTFTIFLATAYQRPIENYPYAIEDHIMHLGEPTWYYAREDFSRGLLVYYFEPASLSCTHFWPEYKAAAKSLAKYSAVHIGKVECFDDNELCQRLGVTSFPTIMLYKGPDGPEWEYTGLRTASALESWVRKVVDGKYPTIDNEETLFRMYSTAILLSKSADYIDSAYSNLVGDVEIAFAGGSLKSRVENVGSIVTHGGLNEALPFSNTTIIEKVTSMLFTEKTGIPTFGARHNKQIKGTQSATFVVYFRTDKFDLKGRSVKAFDKVAEDYKSDNMQFVYANVGNDIFGSTIGRLFGIDSHHEAAVGIIVKQGKVLKKYKLGGNQSITEAAIKELIDSSRSNNGKRYYMSAPIPAEAPKGSIRELVGDNFIEVVADPTVNVFVMLYYPWCEWCIKLEPTWKALAYRYRNVDDLVIARIDVSKNDVEGLDASEFPLLAFYESKKGAEPKEYMSDKTMPALKRFLEKYVPQIKDVEL